MKKKEIEKACFAFESQLQSLGIQFEKIAASSLPELQQKWREVFSANVKKQTGQWIHNGYDWHAFSYGFFPHSSGIEAIQQYESLLTKKIRIIFASKADSIEDIFGYSLESPQKPSYDFLKNFLDEWPRLTDIFVTQANFSWTFVLTHEDFEAGLSHGSYFAMASTAVLKTSAKMAN